MVLSIVLVIPILTLQINGIIERKHRHIVDMGLALLSHASIPLEFWSYAFLHVVYLINMLPFSSLNTSSHFLLLHQKHPDYESLRTFSFECWPLTSPYNQHKFAYCAISNVFVDLSSLHRGYVCYHIPTGRVYLYRCKIQWKFGRLPEHFLAPTYPYLKPPHAFPLHNIM